MQKISDKIRKDGQWKGKTKGNGENDEYIFVLKRNSTTKLWYTHEMGQLTAN